MSGEKVAIRGWTRTQSRLGRRAARPVVVFNILSSMMGVGQAWCIASILGYALTDLHATVASHSISLVVPLVGFLLLALLRAGMMALGDTASAKAGIDARRQLRGSVLASILTGGPALLRQSHSGALTNTAVDRVEALDGFLAGGFLPPSLGL